jgi:hypothetical protein
VRGPGPADGDLLPTHGAEALREKIAKDHRKEKHLLRVRREKQPVALTDDSKSGVPNPIGTVRST